MAVERVGHSECGDLRLHRHVRAGRAGEEGVGWDRHSHCVVHELGAGLNVP